MGGVGSFTIDAGELDAVIGDLEACERELELLISDLEAQMAALHETWEGSTAEAHRVAHDEWTAGMRAMRLAMTALRTAARSAHRNYTTAAQTNVAMWEGMQ